jgi:hypothetical protein
LLVYLQLPVIRLLQSPCYCCCFTKSNFWEYHTVIIGQVNFSAIGLLIMSLKIRVLIIDYWNQERTIDVQICLYVWSTCKKESNEHRSYPYDPIRSKKNVVRFRTIRVVRKWTMTFRQKKCTKQLDVK